MMNINYAYTVEAFYDNATVSVQTDEPNVAISTLAEHMSEGVPTRVVDNRTGEIYVLANWDGEEYITDEWWLMMVGWLKIMMEIGG